MPLVPEAELQRRINAVNEARLVGRAGESPKFGVDKKVSAIDGKRKKNEPQDWKSVGFLVAMLPVGQATIMMMRGVGLRESGLLFTADYAIPGMVEEGEDFVAAAKYRLDTFKTCACDRNGRCKFHGEMLPGSVGPGKWLEEDIARLKKQQAQPMPEAVEILMKAEAARANQRIVVPGRQ